jgi:hypothetical protein
MSLLLLFSGAGESAPAGADSGTGTVALNRSYAAASPTFSVNAHQPLATGGLLWESGIIANSYSHTIGAIGGYLTASIQISASPSTIYDWLSNGIMRHIVVTEPAGQIIWEGFVNSMQIAFGRVSITRGPALQIGNKVSCKYTTVRYDPLGINFGGKPAQTPFVEDSDMQAIYGILETIVTAGEMHEDEAQEIANTHLAEFKYPETTHQISLLGGNSPSVTLECLGYSALLDKYNYTFTDTANEVNLSVKLQDIVEGEPNSYFSVRDDKFTENTLQVIEYEDGSKTGRGLIDDLVARGDANDQRYLWGVYRDRLFHYYPAPVTTDYAFSMSEVGGALLDKDGLIVHPWAVTPGHWVTVSDLTLGGHRLSTTDARSIPTSIFIENLSFTAPYGLDITGGRVSSLRQKLYRLGLGGM